MPDEHNGKSSDHPASATHSKPNEAMLRERLQKQRSRTSSSRRHVAATPASASKPAPAATPVDSTAQVASDAFRTIAEGAASGVSAVCQLGGRVLRMWADSLDAIAGVYRERGQRSAADPGQPAKADVPKK